MSETVVNFCRAAQCPCCWRNPLGAASDLFRAARELDSCKRNSGSKFRRVPKTETFLSQNMRLAISPIGGPDGHVARDQFLLTLRQVQPLASSTSRTQLSGSSRR